MNRHQHVLYLNTAVGVFAVMAPCQQARPDDPLNPGTPASNSISSVIEPEPKGVFRMLRKYGSAPSTNEFEPLTSADKFRLASKDAFGPGTYAGAALSGGIGQWKNSNRSFGQGAAGYSRYFSAALADSVIRTYMTEGVFPSILHQDPRYFRRGTGGAWSRLRYAMGQVFWTHGDSGKTEFNFSELIGNSTAVAISNIYYADRRTASNGVSHLAINLSADMGGNIFKEFWPDFQRKLNRKHHNENAVCDNAISLVDPNPSGIPLAAKVDCTLKSCPRMVTDLHQH